MLSRKLLILLLLWYRKQNRLKRQHRRWYVRPVNLFIRKFGHYNEFVVKLRSRDPEWYFDYFRMSPENFDFILDRIHRDIAHSPTHMMPIYPAERLALTLRYYKFDCVHGRLQ